MYTSYVYVLLRIVTYARHVYTYDIYVDIRVCPSVYIYIYIYDIILKSIYIYREREKSIHMCI